MRGNRSSVRSWALISTFGLLSACGGPSTEGGEGEAEGETAGGEGATVAWHDMTDEQKGQFMAQTVVPEMRALFQEHDATRFADFGCATCHGENGREVGMHMPNGIAPLDPAQIPAMFSSDQPMAQFMVQRVWPRMAELLGEAPYDMETGEGFSCMNCHGTATADAPAGG